MTDERRELGPKLLASIELYIAHLDLELATLSGNETRQLQECRWLLALAADKLEQVM